MMKTGIPPYGNKIEVFMDTEIIAAIIALVGVILSILVSLLISLATTRFNYRQLYAQTVSTNRMDWINKWRENISKFLACAEILNNNCACGNNELITIEKEMYEARGMVVSRLNLDEPNHKAMLVLMNSFVIHCDKQEFIKQREAILALARKILKPEWERVKDEAKGKRYASKR